MKAKFSLVVIFCILISISIIKSKYSQLITSDLDNIEAIANSESSGQGCQSGGSYKCDGKSGYFQYGG